MSNSEKDQDKDKKPEQPKVRLGWGNVKPATKIIPNKRKPKTKRKEKHKGKIEDSG